MCYTSLAPPLSPLQSTYYHVLTLCSLTQGDWRWDSVASIGTRLWVGQPRNCLIPSRVRGFIFPKVSRLVLGSTQLPVQGVLGGKMAGVWRWQPNMRLVPRLRMHIAVPPFLPYFFMECSFYLLHMDVSFASITCKFRLKFVEYATPNLNCVFLYVHVQQ